MWPFSSNKLHGIAALYGNEGSGKTTFLKNQLSLPFFEDYDIIVVGKEKEWKGFKAEQIIYTEKLDKKKLNELTKFKDKIIVIDDADEIAEKFGESKFYSKIKKLSKKNQIIFTAKRLPDYPLDYELIVRVNGIGSKIIVLRHGVRTEYSWESTQDDALFMTAVLE